MMSHNNNHINHMNRHHHHQHQHKPYPTSSNNSTRRRTHLKPSQVAVLQESFVSNIFPDPSMRAQLAQDLGVTERTVQIWFQNRRAKARKLEALSPGGGLPSLVPNVRTGWIDMPHISQPPATTTATPATTSATTTFRSYITPECYENEPSIKRRPRSSSKPEKNTNTFIIPTPPPQRAMSEGMGRIGNNETTATTAKVDKQYLVSFPVNTIRIGSWARFASQINNEWDLVCFSDPTLRQLIWQVQDGGHQFRIEVNFNHIEQIRLGQINSNHDIIGQLEIDVVPTSNSFISFSMRRQGMDGEWVRCGDFTENQQATEGGTHSLQGSHDNLKQSLLELISQAPDLASRLVILPDSNDILCRDLTISPSATPEPMAHYYNNNSYMMMDKGNNLWNTTTPYYQPQTQHQSYDQNSSWTYLNTLQQQQQQQQTSASPLLTTITSASNNVLNSFL